uniref:GH18 domain-containing protein n=1 Tax=Stegastes partitus TaxID=144197 RepID=A0A3B4Z267_9TELE
LGNYNLSNCSMCYILTCYFTNWAQYCPGAGMYLPTDIDPCLCDHLIYAFAGMDNNKIKTSKQHDEKLYGEFQTLKNHKLKTLLANGGGNFAMVSSAASCYTFINSVIKFLQQYQFDGLDLDWEHPDSNSSPPQDKELFMVLTQELMSACQEEGKKTNRPRLVLTAAVTAGKGAIDSGHEISSCLLAIVLDSIHVMTYDFQGPLIKNNTLQDRSSYPSNNGAPAEKLLVCFTFRLASSNTAVGAPTIGPGPSGAFTRQTGFWAYYEVCASAWDNAQQVPYANNQGIWVRYDNVKSFQVKIQWLKQSCFDGAMVWSLSSDNFSDIFCGQGRYPLINTIKSGLGTRQFTPSQQPQPGSSGSTGSGFCAGKANGLYLDPTNKNHFYECNQGQTYVQNCAASLIIWGVMKRVCQLCNHCYNSTTISQDGGEF